MNFTKQTSRPSFLKSKKATLLLLVLGILTLAVSLYNLLQEGDGKYAKGILVIGHAGSGFFSPINPYNPLPANSMASIVQAMEEDGADGVEVDVHVSQDGVPILYHDTSLETMSEGTGMIEQLPAAEVVGLKYKGGILYDLFHDERLVTLEAVLQRFQTYPELPYLHIDVRNHDATRNTFYAQSVLQLLRQYKYPQEKIAFIYPNADILHAIREQEPQAILFLDAGDDFEVTVQEALNQKLDGVTANGKKVNKEQVQRARQQGLQIMLFGGKSGSSIRKMLEMEPNGIQVNNMKRMRALVGE
ncbi:glycerophosphodiester phosphodiesterase [Pontibacter roseus]|uniref:glycerophosphodiester phosphodiesterase n=1 Tax=Pontibacter roseus TaxID=336989 RepID=UPI00035C1334|nr:glycerophosphodiester phosphodiesterase family protein [Pontibacter roseus]